MTLDKLFFSTHSFRQSTNSFRWGLMAADPRGLADLVAPLEGDAGAVRSPGALASAEDATVEVPIVELPEDRAAQAFGPGDTHGPAEDPPGHSADAAAVLHAQAEDGVVAGVGLEAVESAAMELPATPPAVLGSARSLQTHIRALERELDGVHLDAARDRRAHRRLEATVGSLLSELNAARSDVAQLLRRVARLEPAPDGVATPERSRSPPRH